MLAENLGTKRTLHSQKCSTRGTLRTTFLKAKASINGLTSEDTKEVGFKEGWKTMANFIGLMGLTTSATIATTKDTEEEKYFSRIILAAGKEIGKKGILSASVNSKKRSSKRPSQNKRIGQLTSPTQRKTLISKSSKACIIRSQ